LDSQVAIGWAQCVLKAKRYEETVRRLTRAAPQDDASWYAAATLMWVQGDRATAKVLFDRLRRRVPDLATP
jgi:hypothetical protein